MEFVEKIMYRVAVLLFAILVIYSSFYIFFPFKVVVSDHNIDQNWFDKFRTIIIVKQPFSLISNTYAEYQGEYYPAFKSGEVLLSKLEMEVYEDTRMEVARSIYCDNGGFIPLVSIEKTLPKGSYWGDKAVVSDHNFIPIQVSDNNLNVPCYLRFDTDFVVHDDLRRVNYVVKTEKFVIY